MNHEIINIGNYRAADNYKYNEQEYGTTILVHNTVSYDKIKLPTNKMQASAIKLHIDKNNYFYIYNIYNQPSRKYDVRELEKIIDQHNQNLIIMGDFNAHNSLWDTKVITNDKYGKQIESIINNHDVCCLNDAECPTFYSKGHGTFSTIDLTICSDNISDKIEWFVSEDDYSSDHYPVIISIYTETENEKDMRFNTEKANWPQFKLLTEKIPNFDEQLNHNESNKILTETIIKAANKSIPRINPNGRKKTVPWWSEELKKLAYMKHRIKDRINKLNKKHSTLIRNPLAANINEKIIATCLEIAQLKPLFNKYCAKFKREANTAKLTSWQEYVKTINERTPLKKMWKKFRKIKGTNNKQTKHPIKHQGTTIHDEEEIANILGESIAQISSDKTYEKQFLKTKKTEEKKRINFKTNKEEIYNITITQKELNQAIENSKSTTPGEDLVDMNMIKNSSESMKKYILDMYNHLLRNNLLPDNWRHAIVIPIPKPGKDPSCPVNYRPISLTSSLCKLLERIINTRLTWYLREHKIITDKQFGFQQNRSTFDPVASLEDYVRRNYARRRISAAVLFDIEKAYDCTWRYHVMKMMKKAGLAGNIPEWICNFLDNRSFQVKFHRKLSKVFTLQNGLPQGSVLSCTLYLLAINNIVKHLPKEVQCTLYADDIIIYYSSRNLRHLERVLNQTIKKLLQWTRTVGIKLARSKTKAILFYRNKMWLKNNILSLKIETENIEVEKEVKFLGIYFDAHLNWKPHIQYLKRRCTNALNLIKKLSNTKWGAKRTCLQMIYKATIEGILNYCSPIYTSATTAALKTLDTVQTQGLRLCSGAFKSSPNVSVIAESGELPLKYQRELASMKRALKILEGDSPTKQLFFKPDIFKTGQTPPFAMRVRRFIEETNMCIKVPRTPPPNIPHWTINNIKCCTELSKDKSDHPELKRQTAIRHMQTKRDHYPIYTDGSKNHEGTGFAVHTREKNITKSLPREATIFTAEALAIMHATKLASKIGANKIVIYSDSLSVIQAIQRQRSKNPLVLNIKESLTQLQQQDKEITICWIPAHVGVKGNEIVDKLAKEAIKKERSKHIIPTTDYTEDVSKRISAKWKEEWSRITQNKLKELKQGTEKSITNDKLDRRCETVITRLRIGHSKLTHGHLMSNPKEPAPICGTCNQQITIKHIFNDCPDYNNARKANLGNTGDLQVLNCEKEFPASKIIKFLKDINILEKI